MKRQTLFFSATMPDEIRGLAGDILTHPVTVQIGMIAPAETVSHALYPVPDGLKTKLLLTMLQQTPTERVLIFTRTKRRARSLAETLEKSGYRVAALQGNMAQNKRQAAINGFRGGQYDILVATDIAARGIDVASVSHVINYDMPDTVDAYTHRIGRTGRAQLTGEAFTFTEQDDEPMVRAIEKVLGNPVERRRLAGFDYAGYAASAGGQSRPAQPSYASRQSQPSRGTESRNSSKQGYTKPSLCIPRRRPKWRPAGLFQTSAAAGPHGRAGRQPVWPGQARHTAAQRSSSRRRRSNPTPRRSRPQLRRPPGQVCAGPPAVARGRRHSACQGDNGQGARYFHADLQIGLPPAATCAAGGSPDK
ncbi:MAG: DEAD/DEAH box helicase [Tetrasphaera sp.]